MYTRLLKREMAIWKRRKERRQEGGNIQYLVLSRNSTNLAIALIGEAMEGRISPRDAERMLGVGMDAIGKISEKLTKTA
jgi:hypothetical protein